MWIAVRSGGYYFAEQNGKWLATHDGWDFYDVLNEALSMASGEAVKIAELQSDLEAHPIPKPFIQKDNQIPLLDSFKVDHTRIHAPIVRVAKTMTTLKGDTITVFDLCFYVPNKGILSGKDTHTLEYLFAGFMRDHLNGNSVEIIGISPMGCRTGLYMSLIGTSDKQRVAGAWLVSIQDVVNVRDQSRIPGSNEYQCGTYLVHSLAEAQEITQNVLTHKVVVNKNEDLMLDDDLLKGQFLLFNEDEMKAV